MRVTWGYRHSLRRGSVVGQLLPSVLALLILTASVRGDDIFVTSMIGPGSGEIGACPPSCTTGSVSDSGSVAVSAAIPTPVIPGTSRRARFGSANDCSWSVTPTDITQTSSSGTWAFQSLPCSTLYKLYITKGTSQSCSTDVLVNLTVDPGTVLYDTNGTQVASLALHQFQASQPNNVWIYVGVISNSTPNPTVTFTYASGVLSLSSRWYMDALRFESLCACPPTPGRITNVLYGNPITICGTGQVGHLFGLVSSTNLAESLNLWKREQTDYGCSGSFSFRIAPGGENAKFFRVMTQ